MMNRHLFIGLFLTLVALFAFDGNLSAQEYNRERLRGNVRTINQGGLVPIDSAAILREKAAAAARRDSCWNQLKMFDAIIVNINENF